MCKSVHTISTGYLTSKARENILISLFSKCRGKAVLQENASFRFRHSRNVEYHSTLRQGRFENRRQCSHRKESYLALVESIVVRSTASDMPKVENASPPVLQSILETDAMSSEENMSSYRHWRRHLPYTLSHASHPLSHVENELVF